MKNNFLVYVLQFLFCFFFLETQRFYGELNNDYRLFKVKQ